MFNPRAWLVWTGTGLAVALLASNPLYLLIVLLCAALVHASHSAGSSLIPAWRFGLAVMGFSTLYNLALTHFGATVLVTIPRGLPLLGGPVTVEAAMYGLSRGLALWTLLAVSSVFNDLVTPYELVRLTPRFLRQAGLVISIMLAFVPQVARTFQQVREAQAIRGHQLRGVRDLPALIVPLMADSLEKAVQLAEAMEARGYGHDGGPARTLSPQLLMVGGLATILAGWLVEAYWRDGTGWAIIAAGAAALMAGFRAASAAAQPSTRYRARGWSPADWLVIAVSLAALGACAAAAVWEPSTLAYDPYPRAIFPAFDPRLGVCLALLAIPALARPAQEKGTVAPTPATAGK